MPLEWISNYENFKKNSTLAVATGATFRRSVVKTIFQRADKEEASGRIPPIFLIMMIAFGTTEKRLPIHAIKPNG